MTFLKRRTLGAYTVFRWMSFLESLAFYLIITIDMVYQVEVVKLNPLQLVLVGTVLESTVFVAQIPTGILADVYSRRGAVILGVFLTAVGFSLEAAPAFLVILLAQVFWGLGVTFVDGAREAWLTDELGNEGIGQVFLRGSQFAQLGTLLAIPISVSLAILGLAVPILIGSSLYLVLALFLVLCMPEHGFQPRPKGEHPSWRALGGQIRAGWSAVRVSPLLITFGVLTIIGGTASEGFDRLKTAHFILDYHFPSLGPLNTVVWFGIIRFGSALLGLLVAEIVRRFVNTQRHRALVWTLFVFEGLAIVSIVTFALAGNFLLALAAYWSAETFRKAGIPLSNTWLALNIAPKVRATVFSMFGQADAIGQIAGGPIVGLIGTVVSLPIALLTTGLMQVPILPLYLRALGQGKPPVSADDEEIAEPEPLTSVH